MSPAQPDDVAALASMDFESWVRQPGDWLPPTNDAWPLLANPNLLMLRLGFELLHKSKAELVAAARFNPKSAKSVHERLHATHDMFAHWANVIGTAEARVLCALAVIQSETPGAET
jgi:hypothetical protein